MNIRANDAEFVKFRSELISALDKLRRGDFSVRLAEEGVGADRELAALFNELVVHQQQLSLERELQHARLRQISMLESLPLALYEARLDERGRLVRRLIGGDLKKIAGDDAAALTSGEMSWEEGIAPEDSAALDRRASNSTEATRTAHYRWLRRDGTSIHVLDQGVSTGDGGWAGAMFDVTAQRELEQQLVQARKAEALGQLTGGIAHDFNNLLAAVLGGLRLIEARVNLGPREKQILEHMRHAGERGAEHVRRLMAFARKQELSPRQVDPRTLCQHVAGLTKHALSPDTDVRWHMPGSCPKLFVDETQLELALVNLLINARDAMPGGGCVDVIVEEVAGPAPEGTGERRDLLQIRVRDQGCGIPPELLERVTEPFFTTKRAGEGTGLGLSMVAGFIEQSGGTLRIDSEPGNGTEIAMILPATRASEAETPRTPEPAGEVRVRSVLLVDDDEGVREILSEQLRDLGLQVTVASNAQDAFELLERSGNCPEFVLTDFSMPGLDGMELLDRLCRRWPSVRGAIMTGNPQDRLSQLTISVPILHKPIGLPDLKRLLANG